MKNIVIFDFDCTITSRHWYYFMREPKSAARNPDLTYHTYMQKLYNDCLQITNNRQDDRNYSDNELKDELIKNFFGCSERYEKLVQMLHYIQSNNNEIVILSNGYSNDIHFLLRYIGIDMYFNHVIGIRDQNIEGYTKVNYLIYYHKQLENTANYVFYVDDDPSEHSIYMTHLREYNNNPRIDIEHKTFVLFFNDRCRYIFYNGLKHEGTGMSINDMENIKEYIMMYPVMNTNTIEQKVSDIHIIDRYPHATTRPVAPPPAPAPSLYNVMNDNDDIDKDPFAEDGSDISDSLNGGKYYTLYKKNKNKNNRLSSTKL